MEDTLTLPDVEIVEAPAVEKTTAIAENIASVHGEVAKFDAINAGLAAIEKDYPLDVIVAEINTLGGMRSAEAAWRAYRNPRLEVERARKGAKAPVLALGRAIDSFAGQLEERLRKGEDHYKAQIDAEEARRAAVKAEAERKERARIEERRAGIDKLRSYVERAVGQPSASIQKAIDVLGGLQFNADHWQEFTTAATAARDETVTQLRVMHCKAVEAEAQAAENERLRALAEAQAAEMKALQEKVAAEQAARDEEQRLQQASQVQPAPVPLSDPQPEASALQPAPVAEEAGAAPAPADQLDEQATDRVIGRSWTFPPPVESSPAASPERAEVTQDDGPMCKLADVCSMLGGLNLSAPFIAGTLGITHTKRDRAAFIYTTRQVRQIRDALVTMLQGVDL